MKGIKNLVAMTNNDMEVLALVMALAVLGVAMVVAFAGVHWMCGVMAVPCYVMMIDGVAHLLEKPQGDDQN